MPKYKVGEKVYDIPNDKVKDFLKAAPEATSLGNASTPVENAPAGVNEAQSMVSNLGVYSLGSLSTKLAAAKLINRDSKETSPIRYMVPLDSEGGGGTDDGEARTIEEINEDKEELREQQKEAEAAQKTAEEQERQRRLNAEIAAAANQQYRDYAAQLENLPLMSVEAVDIQRAMDNIVQLEYERLYDPNFQNKSDYDYNKAQVEQINVPKTFEETIVMYDEDGNVTQDRNEAVRYNDALQYTYNTEDLSEADQNVLSQQRKYDRVLEIYSSTEGLKIDNTFFGMDFFEQEMPEEERYEINEEVKRELIGLLGEYGVNRAIALSNEGTLDLIGIEERQQLLLQAQGNVLKRRNENIAQSFEGIVEKQNVTKTNQDILNQEIEETVEIYSSKFASLKKKFDVLGPVDQYSDEQAIVAYNKLVSEYQNLDKEYKQYVESSGKRQDFINTQIKGINGLLETLQEDYENTNLDLNYNSLTQEFNVPFENTTQAYKDYKERFYTKAQKSDSMFMGEVYKFTDQILKTGEAAYTTLSNLIVPLFIVEAGATIYDATALDNFNKYGYQGPNSYSRIDNLLETFFGSDVIDLPSSDVDTFTTEDFDAIAKGEFRDFFADGNAGRKTVNGVLSMIPYVVGIVKGKNYKSLDDVSKTFRDGHKKVFKNRSAEDILRDANMMNASFKMTVFDAYQEGQDMGLDKQSALVFGTVSATVTALTQMIMPDAKFFTGAKGKAILEAFAGNLTKATNREARRAAVSTYIKSIFKEIGEEELDFLSQEILKSISSANHENHMLSASAHLELMFATISLSGTIGLAGARNQYKNEKKNLNKLLLRETYDINNSLNDRLSVIQRKMQIVNGLTTLSQKQKERRIKDLEEQAQSIYKAQTYNNNIKNAIAVAPEFINYDQLDILRQRQELENELKTSKGEKKKEVQEKISELEVEFENAKVNQEADVVLDRTIEAVQDFSGDSFIVGEDVEDTQQKLTAVNEAYKEINEQEGREVYRILTDQEIENAARQEGFNFGDVKIINKQVSRATGNTNVAAHEFLHDILKGTLNTNKQAALKIADAFGNLLISLDPEQFNNSTFRKKLELYQTTQADINRIVEQNPNATDQELDELINQQIDEDIHKQAIEVITLASDAFATGDLSFDVLQKRGLTDRIRRVRQNLQGTFLDRFAMEIEFNDGADVFNFVKDYNTSVKKKRLTKAQRALLDGKIQGRLTEGEQTQDVGPQESRVYQRVEERKDQITSTDEDTKREGVFMAAMELENEIDRRLPKIEGMTAEERADVVRNFMFNETRGLVGLLNRYNPDINDSVMGYLNSKQRGISLLDARLQEFYQNDPRFGNIIQSTSEEAVGTKVERRTAEDSEPSAKPKQPRTKGVIVAKRFNAVKDAQELANKEFDNIKNDITSLADTPRIMTKLISKITGIPVKKLQEFIIDENGKKVKNPSYLANLSDSELASAQRAIKKYDSVILEILPKQHTVKMVKVKGADGVTREVERPDKATKISGKVKKALYVKGKRKDNLTPFNKKPGLKEKDVRELAGIVDGIPDRSDRNTSASVLGIWTTVDKTWSNQEIRLEAQRRGLPLSWIAGIRNGNDAILFSKSGVQEVGSFARSIPVESRGFFFDRMPEFANEPVLGNDYKSIENAVQRIWGDLPFVDVPTVARGIHKAFQYITPKIAKDPVKLAEKLLAVDNDMLSKVKQFAGSSIEASKAFQDPERVKKMVATQTAIANELWDPSNPELSIAKIMMMKNHLASMSKNSYLKRTQPFPPGQAFIDNTLLKIPEVKKVNTKTDKRGGISVVSVVLKNGTVVKPANISSSQSSETAVKQFKNGDLTKREQDEIIAQELLNDIVEITSRYFKEGTIDNVDLMMNMASLLSGMNSVLARAGKLKYITPRARDGKGPLRYEHMIPRVVVLMNIFDAHINGNGINNVAEFLQNYEVAVTSVDMDDVFKDAGYNSSLPVGVTMQDPSWFRYYNAETLQASNNRLEPLIDEKGNVLKISDAYSKVSNMLTSRDNTNMGIMMSKASFNARSTNANTPSRGASVFDFDETLIIDGENFIVATDPETGDRTKISSGDWPLKGPKFAERGFTFDFTDFVNVRGGVEGPLLNKLRNRIAKYGPKNNFILTARPAESATAIHEWLKTKGINIPLENITGLGNSSGDAKAAWFLDKYAEGYNDMYFVDDALPNVEAVAHVFDQLDMKGKSVQAKIQFSKSLNDGFNKMLERNKGVGAEKRFSRVEAAKRGKNKGGFTLFVPPSAEDFTGLLRYFVGRGAEGDADIKFFEEALVKPFARADREMTEFKQRMRDEYKALRKAFPDVKKRLGKELEIKGYTLDSAIRVYLFDKAGYEIPGLAESTKRKLIKIVESDAEAKAFADGLSMVTRESNGYTKPDEFWDVGNIAMDLDNAVNKVSRSEFLAEWIQNKDEIFSQENLNKIEAIYGTNFRSALEDILYRMQTGQNRPKGRTAFENKWNNWINASVGAIMFFNGRSSVLQTLSTVNFINFEDNNIFKAARAFANQKQYWSDFVFLFNSDFLKNRRAGLATNVNEAELANAVAGAKNKAMAALRYLLKIGFTPTQVADSFAIASGGATFYRNRVNKYLKEGKSQQEAEDQAMLDFREIAEETQQSARPDRISQQQASNLGRIILAFANTPMQYNRLIKKAAGDLINKRGDWRSNVSRILYYGAMQNFIFAALQNALFAMAFSEEDDEEKEEIKESRILNSMLDSLLRGSGIYGAALSTIKNTILEYREQEEKGFRADYGQVVVEALNVSPPLGSKARKLYSAMLTRKYNKEVMNRMSMFDYNNPAWLAIGNVVEATTNIPMARAIRKIDNLREAMNQENTNMQRLFLALGWSSWDLNVGEKVIRNEGRDDEYTVFLDTRRKAVEDVKTEIKEEKKQETVRKKEEKKKEKEQQQQEIVEENIKKQKEEGEDATCAAMTSSGERCKRKPVDGKSFCTVHEKVEKSESGEMKQCKKIKSDGERCKMQTSSKSGFCYYHD